MNELKVKCPNYKCCGIITNRDQIDKHYKTCWASKCNNRDNHEIGNCPLQIISCNNSGCNVKMQRSDLLRYHMNQCQFRNGNMMNICTNAPSKENKRILTQQELEIIKQKRAQALERRRRWNLSQMSQMSQNNEDYLTQECNDNHRNSNRYNNNSQLTDEQRRRIEQNRQRALERRRAYQQKLAMSQR